MELKEGLSLAGVRPEIVLGLLVTDGVFTARGEKFTVTEISGGTHKPGSLHYVGLAFDARTRDLKGSAAELVQALKVALGAEFDVVLEQTHLHIEYQPKRNRS